MEGSGAFRDDSFTKDLRLIIPKSGRADTRGVQMLYGERTDPQTTPTSLRLSMREWDFNLQCFCQRDLCPPDVLELPNKPVWLWSTVGTLAAPVYRSPKRSKWIFYLIPSSFKLYFQALNAALQSLTEEELLLLVHVA